MKKIIYIIIPLLIIGVSIEIVNSKENSPKDLTQKTTQQESPNKNTDQIAKEGESTTTATTTVEKPKTTENTTAEKNKKEITNYTVKSGDTLSGIATKFGISTKTIISANNLNADNVLQSGDKLTILPINGILYTVESGDTVSGIALKYDIEAEDIISANDLLENDTLKIGQKLILPGATKTSTSASRKTTTTKTTKTKATTPGSAHTPKPASTKKTSGTITWTAGAIQELNRAPSFVRPTLKAKVNNYARKHGITVITRHVYNNIRV